jgi:hypothetical protein
MRHGGHAQDLLAGAEGENVLGLENGALGFTKIGGAGFNRARIVCKSMNVIGRSLSPVVRLSAG